MNAIVGREDKRLEALAVKQRLSSPSLCSKDGDPDLEYRGGLFLVSS